MKKSYCVADAVRNMVLFKPKKTLAQAARSVGYSPKYFSREFKRYAGMSYTDFRLRWNVEKTKDLLMSKAGLVQDISGKVGYKNAENLIRIFSRYVGMTPKKYSSKGFLAAKQFVS